MDISFETPPINEVVIGVNFVPRSDLLVPLFGKFWGLISERYSQVSHAQPFVLAGTTPIQDSTGAWLPRVWFSTPGDEWLVQLQQDIMFVNWRQQSEVTYPRFPAVRDEFYRIWRLFCSFLEAETGTPPQITRMEVQYINAIPDGEGWSTVPELGGVLRDFKWADGSRYLPQPKRFASTFEFEGPDATTLYARAGMGKRVADQKEVFRFELNANRVFEEDTDMEAWIKTAHDLIVHAFKDMTTPEMHRQWKLEGEANG